MSIEPLHSLPSLYLCEPAQRREQPPKERKREEEHRNRDPRKKIQSKVQAFTVIKCVGLAGSYQIVSRAPMNIGPAATACVGNLVDLSRADGEGVNIIIASVHIVI